MNREPKLSRWKGAEILAGDLPAGVTYRYDGGSTYLSLSGGGSVWLEDSDGQPHYALSCERGKWPVHILDWPDHCGPRPDAKPTWKQIVEGAPDDNARPVFLKDGLEHVWLSRIGSLNAVSDQPFDGCGTFLGYLVWEEA